MNQHLKVTATICQRIPHTRGDEPMTVKKFQREIAYSPHAWGWTNSKYCLCKSSWVFPTRVGMNQRKAKAETRYWRIPHTRGDEPAFVSNLLLPELYSPHSWGWTSARQGLFSWIPVFPTRVGMNQYGYIYLNTCYGIPHTRGDEPLSLAADYDSEMYSPHSWGWTNARPPFIPRKWVFPTLVGMNH